MFHGWLAKWTSEDQPGIFTRATLQPPNHKVDLSLESEEWESTGAEVDQLFIYPMKSAKGISLDEANVGEFGLWNESILDRQFMIIESNQERIKDRPHVSARIYPKLVLLESNVISGPDVDDKVLHLKAPDALNMPDLFVTLPKNPDDCSLTYTAIFGSDCAGVDLGEVASNWITQFLNKCHATSKEFRILYHPYSPGKYEKNFYEKKEPDELIPQMKADDSALFADGFPILLIGRKSLDEINRRLKSGKNDLIVDIRRFRTNIFVKNSGLPFEEDDWLYIRIGDSVFRNAKLCARCILTTVDPDTGEKDRNMQPLRTLKSFRVSQDKRELEKFGNSPFVGLNLVLENPDKNCIKKIRKGDKLWVIKQQRIINTSLTCETSGIPWWIMSASSILLLLAVLYPKR